jgi:hypothetical protein
MHEATITMPVKELRELRKAFLMLRGLFDTSLEYAERLSPGDMAHRVMLTNNLAHGQRKAQEFFGKAKELEKS